RSSWLLSPPNNSVRQGVAAPIFTRDSKGAILLKTEAKYKKNQRIFNAKAQRTAKVRKEDQNK
ncbi:MAG: hypothetical protein KAT06_11930, partial [Gammaproteobacteria bacterium]|nr:hypothetical protein [Gammaproteobacteria bacterium]